MPKQKFSLVECCAELAESWINGNRSFVLAEISKAGRPHKRCIAVAIGTLRHLGCNYGDDHASDFASALTKPYGGHFG